MQITNEEMEALNRASEILSKYAAQGGLSRADFEHYEKMVIAIIDEYGTKAGKYQEERKQAICVLVAVLSTVIQRQKNRQTQVGEQRQIVYPKATSTSSFAMPHVPIMNRVYLEKLRSGGELKIEEDHWSIQYNFPGPDPRFNGTIVTIRGQDIDRYIGAWRSNLKKMFEFSRIMVKGGQFEIIGDMNMTICIGGNSEGVYLRGHHLRASTPREVNEIIKDYEYARMRGEQIISCSRR